MFSLKQGHNFSGQIMPFLLVILAIFLGAFFATYKIGGNAINATCIDNSADACALAAASDMAYTLNAIHKWAKDFQKEDFNNFENHLKTRSAMIRSNLISAKTKITQAKAMLNSAKTQATPGAFCTVWDSAHSASANLTQAADLIQSAINSLAKVYNITVTMKAKIQEYKNKTKTKYCDALQGVNNGRTQAKSDGVTYANQNSCGHSISADVTIPKLDSFKLEVTKMNNPCGPQNMPGSLSTGAKDPYGMSSYTLLGLQLYTISGKLRDSSAEEESIYAATQDALSSDCPPYPSSATGHCCSGNFGPLVGRANAVIAQIDASLNDFNTASAAIDSLIQYTKDIVKDLGRDAGKRIVSSRSCADAGDVIIVGIDGIKFKTGCVKCNITSTGTGATTGKSTSSFGGGSLRWGEPKQHYLPKVTENSCPNNGGLTTGTTTNFNHSDGGC